MYTRDVPSRASLLLYLNIKGGAFCTAKGSAFGQGGELIYIDNAAVSQVFAWGVRCQALRGQGSRETDRIGRPREGRQSLVSTALYFVPMRQTARL